MTQTTRKVLVKKLKAAAEKEKQKTRRETIAVTKFSSDEAGDSEPERKKSEKASSRRATIAPGEKITKAATSTSNGVSAVSEEMPAPRSTRRSSSGRSTPQASEKPVAVSSSVPQVPAILEDTDEEVKETLKSPPKRFSKSKSKTPTLSKTDTVRISYKSTQEKVPESDEDVVIVGDEEEPLILTQRVPERKTITTKTESNMSRRKTFTTSGIPTLGTSSTFTSSIPSTSTRYSSVLDSKYDRPSYSTSYSFTNLGSKVSEVDVDDIEENAPYLSNFAKRLSTLRAEPLDASLDMDKYKKLRENVEYPSYRSSISTTYKRDVLPAQSKPSLGASFIQVLEALDRQYHIRKTLYFLCVIILLIALYVFFF